MLTGVGYCNKQAKNKKTDSFSSLPRVAFQSPTKRQNLLSWEHPPSTPADASQLAMSYCKSVLQHGRSHSRPASSDFQNISSNFRVAFEICYPSQTGGPLGHSSLAWQTG